jgi:peptide/nickel transport system ATP-binding protein
VTLLDVHDLTISREGRDAAIVREATLVLDPRETLGIAGESGCGKSTLLLALMGVVKPGLAVTGGHVHVMGQDLGSIAPEAMRRLRGPTVALVPQSAAMALTPTMRVGAQLSEAMSVHDSIPTDAIAARTTALFARVRLPEPDRIGARYPHELSGGQMQRVAIAMALACEPKLLLLDEPTTGLDVTTQAGILDLLDELRRETGMAMVCVSHDIGVLARLTARIAVMYAGRIVEDRSTADLLTRPAHPYARALMASVPRIDRPGLPPSIPGSPPAPGMTGPGCAFAPRCGRARAACELVPALSPLPHGGRIACHAPDDGPLAPAVMPVPPVAQGAGPPVIVVRDLVVQYRRASLLARLLRRSMPDPVVAGVSLTLAKGEILGLVGESGSGKSTILRAIAGLWPPSAGRITLDGANLPARVTERDRAALRRVQVVFQNPDASLNPRHTVREILAQPLRLYFNASPTEVESRARRLITDVRLDPAHLDRRPAELSGGERQRVALARAFAAEPEVILCDEVTSALDVSVQASVLALIHDLCHARGTSCLFVAHDLAVVAALCDRVAVLHQGRIVEEGPARSVCSHPVHPYTISLIGAVQLHEGSTSENRNGPQDRAEEVLVLRT